MKDFCREVRLNGRVGHTDIAIPVRNGGELVARAVASALAQAVDVPDLEVHVFDNASTDATVATCRTLLPVDQVHEAAEGGPAAVSFSRAFEGTTGELFAWLAHDDALDPGFVAHCVDALTDAPWACAALPSVRFEGSGPQAGAWRSPDPRLCSPRRWTRLAAFLDEDVWLETYALHRREMLAGAMPMPATYAMDVVLSWRLLVENRFCTAPLAVLVYQVFEHKTTASSVADYLSPVQSLRWLNAGLWGTLWRESATHACSPRARRTARLALLRVLVRRNGRRHLLADIASATLRPPGERRSPLLLLATAVLDPRRAFSSARRDVPRPAG